MRYFYCTEDGKLYSENDLLRDYCDFLRTDEEYKSISFDRYIETCLDKNGSLLEIKNPIGEAQAEKINSAMADFMTAFDKLKSAFSHVSEESFNEYLSANYPFSVSFDELTFLMESWAYDVYNYSIRLSRD